MVYLSSMRAIFLNSTKFQTRVPSIKFRKGGLAPTVTGSSAAPQVKKTSGKTNEPQIQKAKGGATQTTIVLEELPARFHRKPLSVEEIEIINNGGVR